LQLRTQPKALAAALLELMAEVQRQEPAGLAGCAEYALLPLLFLVDSIAAMRAASPGAQLASTGYVIVSLNRPVHSARLELALPWEFMDARDLNHVIAHPTKLESVAAGGTVADAPAPPFPAARSDAVAEAALAALAAVLDTAAPQLADTLVPLLERVLRVAALPRSSAAEEVGFTGCRHLLLSMCL
jgi:hypothetical protein